MIFVESWNSLRNADILRYQIGWRSSDKIQITKKKENKGKNFENIFPNKKRENIFPV